MTKIMFVCLGNICRSTMAEFVMKDIVKNQGEERPFIIRSSATSSEAVGSDIHRGTKNILDKYNIPYEKREAVQIKKSDYDKYDYIIGMDKANIDDLLRIFGGDPENKVRLLLSFANLDRNIADPWYTGDFQKTYDDVLLGCNALFKQLS